MNNGNTMSVETSLSFRVALSRVGTQAPAFVVLGCTGEVFNGGSVEAVAANVREWADQSCTALELMVAFAEARAELERCAHLEALLEALEELAAEVVGN